jgi:phosphomannomutase
MPEISRFFGIVIRMYFLDHEPPHFHASYGGREAQVRIDPVGLLSGTLPPRALALVVEWTTLHQEELLENWRRLHTDQAPHRIDPLE